MNTKKNVSAVILRSGTLTAIGLCAILGTTFPPRGAPFHMALKAAIHKAQLEIVDLDRRIYETRRLTLARHPSETEERLMVRLLVYALNYSPGLEFGGGVAAADEADLWERDPSGDIKLWIEIGHPDAKLLAKALGRARRVVCYTYSALPERWWNPIAAEFAPDAALEIVAVDAAAANALAALSAPGIDLQVQVQDGEIWVRDSAAAAVKVDIRTLRPSGAA